MIVIMERKYIWGMYLAHQHSGLDNIDTTKPIMSIFSFLFIDLLNNIKIYRERVGTITFGIQR